MNYSVDWDGPGERDHDDCAMVLAPDSPCRMPPMVVWPEFMRAIGYPGDLLPTGVHVIWMGHHFQVAHALLLQSYVEDEWGRLVEREPGR